MCERETVSEESCCVKEFDDVFQMVVEKYGDGRQTVSSEQVSLQPDDLNGQHLIYLQPPTPYLDVEKSGPVGTVYEGHATNQYGTNMVNDGFFLNVDNRGFATENSFYEPTDNTGYDNYVFCSSQTEVSAEQWNETSPELMNNFARSNTEYGAMGVKKLPPADSLLQARAYDASYSSVSSGTGSSTDQQLCNSVSKLNLKERGQSGESQTELKSRKRKSTCGGLSATHSSIAQLEAEIAQLEKDPKCDVNELKKKKNNLACRYHRIKKKRHEDELEIGKVSIERELEMIKKELQDVKTENLKYRKALVQVVTDSGVPEKRRKSVKKLLDLD